MSFPDISVNEPVTEGHLRLWCECFGDDRATAAAFFAIPGIDRLTLHVANCPTPCGILNMVPVGCENVKGAYIYGVGVSPEMRGQGFFRLMMNYAENFAVRKKLGFLCLIPADEKLAFTYKNFGYTVKVSRYGTAPEDGKSIIHSDNAGFSAFAAPVSGEHANTELLCGYGLLKPVNKSISGMSGFAFGSFMGEF